ncbi:MAG: aspartate--tRNA(Asn) ligase [Thaumarchaeota archaeon]|nr:MAG: aspartate--tRNA(Asn) ligase [Nitrososphaerota archaeon]
MVKESKVARNGFEILPEKVTVVARASVPLPLDPRGVTPAALDTRLSWRTLDLRRREGTAVFKIENTLVSAMEAYLRENGFIRVFTPSIIGGTSEGGSEVFKIDYYGRPAFLRQDPQLHRQLTIAGGFDKIYDLGANWRAELSHTPRHISEHRTIAPEMAFIEDERDTMKIEEGMVAASMKAVIEGCGEELGTLGVKLDGPSRPFPEFQFPDVYKLLEGWGRRVQRGEDLDTESQRVLGEYAKKEFGSDFFFLNRFPSKIKPFYVMKVDEDPEWARSVDLVYKGVELSSGGQREHRHDRILKQMREKGMDEASLKWFTEPFRYGVPPHGGYSFGIERFAAGLANLSSVKEAALFPRDPERLQP